MKRLWARALLLPIALLLLALPADRSLTNPIFVLHMDLELALPGVGTIPGDGSTWHEIWFEYCNSWTQVSYADRDGDSALSNDDFIRLSGDWEELFRIEWVGLDYFLSYLPEEGGEPLEFVYNPAGVNCTYPLSEHDPANPVGETWSELHPGFCSTIRIDQWLDHNQNQMLDEDDEVLYFPDGVVEPEVYRITRVATAVNVIAPAIGTKTESWGEVKEKFAKDTE